MVGRKSLKNKYLTTAIIATLIVLLGSCTPLSKQVYKTPPVQTKRDYDVVQIPDFRKNEDIWVPYDSTTEIPDMLYERLLESGMYSLVERNSGPVEYDERVLVVKGVVTDYDRGCKFCEWFFFGINDKGKSTTSVWVELVDKSTGEIITDFSLHGRAEDPGYGRSRYTRIVEEIQSVIEKVSK